MLENSLPLSNTIHYWVMDPYDDIMTIFESNYKNNNVFYIKYYFKCNIKMLILEFNFSFLLSANLNMASL